MLRCSFSRCAAALSLALFAGACQLLARNGAATPPLAPAAAPSSAPGLPTNAASPISADACAEKNQAMPAASSHPLADAGSDSLGSDASEQASESPADAGVEASTDGGKPKVTLNSEWHAGRIKYYPTHGGGSCALPPLAGVDFVAVPRWLYQGMDTCGACLEIEGPSGKIVSLVSDLCAGCKPDVLDVSKQGFAQIAKGKQGEAPVRWRFVSCPVSTAMQYRFKEGSFRWWAAFQVRSHRLPIQKIELRRGDHWEPLERTRDNFWSVARGFGMPVAILRLTSLDGVQVEERISQWRAKQTTQGEAQFPALSP